MNLTENKNNTEYAVFVDASGTILGGSQTGALGVELYPDSIKLLNAMRARNINGINIKTGLITNWGKKINAMLKALNVMDCFDVVISSDSVAKGKPDSETFHYACSLVEVEPKNAIHIGDSLFDDALGAQNAGLHGIWLRRTPYSNKDSKTLKHPIFSNLNEVLLYLETIIRK
ncbi:HAD family hydrolase [Fluviispira vulneris]|uniref:HAD family hydrolase n=1 Tax=Fluviispira vulneris TaxID=2763012 RepID=UPI001646EF82|nr:HAD family hydrolase [Fluviispira vulneris]